MPNGSRRHLLANKLRKLVVPVTHIGISSENDAEFGEVLAVPVLPHKTGVTHLPSQRTDLSSLSHLSEEQKNALLQLLDEFKECFDDTPGLCTVVQHEIPLTDNFKPRQTRAYRVPELLKAEIEKQISKLLELDFSEETDSPMCIKLLKLNSYRSAMLSQVFGRSWFVLKIAGNVLLLRIMVYGHGSACHLVCGTLQQLRLFARFCFRSATIVMLTLMTLTQSVTHLLIT